MAALAAALGGAWACDGRPADVPTPWDDAALRARAQDPVRRAKGASLFGLHCVSCHGPDGKGGEGLLGPDLTDDAWIRGSRPTEIYRAIATGSIAKGMQPWRHLGEERVADLAAFVVGLRDE